MASTHIKIVSGADVVPTPAAMPGGGARRVDTVIKRVSQLAGYSVLAASYIFLMLILF